MNSNLKMEDKAGKSPITCIKQENGGVFLVEEAIEIYTVDPGNSEYDVDSVKQEEMSVDNGNRSLIKDENADYQTNTSWTHAVDRDNSNIGVDNRDHGKGGKEQIDSYEDSGGKRSPSKRRIKKPNRFYDVDYTNTGHSNALKRNSSITEKQSNSRSYVSNEKLSMGESEVLFKCHFCRLQKKKHVCSSNIEFKRHLLQRHTTTMYSCSVCRFQSRKTSLLLKHIRTHSAEEFSNCDRLTKSTLNDSGEEYSCDFKCVVESELTEHENMHIKEISDSISNTTIHEDLRCELCDFKCSLKSDLTEHRTVNHGGEKPFGCFVCDLTFYTASELKDHLRTHSVVPNPTSPSDVVNHDYKCTAENVMTVHEATDSDEKPFLCDKCGYCCNQLSDLKIHEETHMCEESYRCSECEFECTSSDSLVEHVEREHPVRCTMCGFECTEKMRLAKHMVQKHNRELELLFS